MAWSETSGAVVGANIIPSSPMDKYPTHHAIFGRGGYKTVANEVERLAIPVDRLTIGSVVRQHDNGIEYVVTKLPDVINSDLHTGKDCTWEQIKSGGLDEEALKEKYPNGIAELGTDGLVKESLARSHIYRGKYIDENTFEIATGPVQYFRENAIYIDNNTNRMYFYNGSKLVRDTIYWQEV